MVGEILGGYRLVQEIGRGGMGSVYLAEHTRINRKAAVKVLLPEYSGKPEVVERFFAEARAASMISHPGIVEILDCDVHSSGLIFIVMEYLEGESLAALLARTGGISNDIKSYARIGAEVANAMAAAHARGIVHRDLKPDNILLVARPAEPNSLQAKIVDFGIAKLLTRDGSIAQTRAGLVMGTPLYMSPEQCRGQPDLSAASDIYSLGCILFEMACGRPPFTEESTADLLVAHLTHPPPALSSIRPGLPADLEMLVSQMLAKEPAGRPHDMGEVEARLEQIGRSGQQRVKTVILGSRPATGAGTLPPHEEDPEEEEEAEQPVARPPTPTPSFPLVAASAIALLVIGSAGL